ncbi:site-specific integrase [Halomonas sp. YLGW01]|uniref:tyrosine-type recombinase/integrase n=1 Tax=Halomonas sp. YLGW01 TaxID=2773308 RepID=UPI00177E4E68|nr:site-specific integrase [Halomonas sp. YLGW01]
MRQSEGESGGEGAGERAGQIGPAEEATQALIGALDSGLATAPANLIDARDDIQAVGAWLNEYRQSPQTFRAYRKEAERLLLWLSAEGEQGRGDRLDSLDRGRLEAFAQFLADPRPASRWIGTVRKRQHPGWRPFRGPLSPASRRQSLVILQGLYGYLVEAGYLTRNPFRLVRDKRRLSNGQARIERYLERPDWDWLWRRLERQCADLYDEGEVGRGRDARARLEAERRRFLFAFAYLLAPRIAEMAAARMGDIRRREGRWWWRVVGKGRKAAEIPVPPTMMEALARWRLVRGLSAQPRPVAEDEALPLLTRLDGQTTVGDNLLYRLITGYFRDAAAEIEQRLAGEPGDDAGQHDWARLARTLKQATPHWLRHTAITHQAQAGVELRFLARSARHSRLDTTSRYLHAEDQEWQQQMTRHALSLAEEEP